MSKRLTLGRECSARALVEVIKAAHLSTLVDSSFQSYGGIMVSGPPGVMKTTILEALDPYETALPLSDVNAQRLNSIRNRLTDNSIRTIVLPEMQKLYEHDLRTSMNVEGTLREFVEEGFRGASFDEPTATRFRSRAMVIGAMTDQMKQTFWRRWEETGFTRRFLWVLIRLKNPALLMDAVEDGVKAQFIEPVLAMNTPNGRIAAIGPELRKKIRPLVKHQPKPSNVQFELLCRICAVLDYFYARANGAGRRRTGYDTLVEFSPAIMGGADVTGFELNGKVY